MPPRVDKDLIVFHVIAAEDENALGHLVRNRVRKRVTVGAWALEEFWSGMAYEERY